MPLRKSTAPEKAKIAERVIEVLDLFAQLNRPVTVTDILHRTERPQSSTSELLKTLVRMGILYRDAESRTYVPTPRLAALTRALQPEPIADGRLFAYMERLAQTARCGVGLFGMVGTQVQLLHWADGMPEPEPQSGSTRVGPVRRPGPNTGLATGATTRLSSSAAGLLLLSALGGERAAKVLWRLHAEAAQEADRFNLTEAKQTVDQCTRAGRIVGPCGFVPEMSLAAILLPGAPLFPDLQGERSLVLGAVYRSGEGHDPLAMLATLEAGARGCFASGEGEGFVSGVG